MSQDPNWPPSDPEGRCETCRRPRFSDRHLAQVTRERDALRDRVAELTTWSARALAAGLAVWNSRARWIAAAAPRVITDPAELEALPTGAVVLDHAPPRDAYTKRAHGYGWYGTGSSLSATSSEVLRWGEDRVTVLFVPTEEASGE